MRVNLIQDLFCVEMAKVDPNFFIQMNESRLGSVTKSRKRLSAANGLTGSTTGASRQCTI